MVYETISDRNTSEGLHVMLVYVADVVPIFIPLVLFGFFIIIALGTYNSQTRTRGKGDFPASFAVAGFATAVLAIVMSLIDGLIPLPVVTITIVVSVVGLLWLYISKEK